MKYIDGILVGTVFLLALFGLLMIYEASSYIAFRDFGDKYYYIREQAIWLLLGAAGLTFFSYFDYRKLYNLALPILLLTLGLLILVFIPGMGIHALGATRWIALGNFVFQPTEFAKLSLCVYLAAWFSNKEKGRLIAFYLLLGIVLLLIMMQPDLGTALIILLGALSIYFLSGANILHFVVMIPVIAGIILTLVLLAPYRAARLSAFINIARSLESTPYHIKQILIALGMGGLAGVGLGNSLQKYAYLPENTTDSIFAIIAEEFGFLGSILLVLTYLVVVWRGFVIVSKTSDRFGKLLAGGIISIFAIQTIINLGAQTALIPLTGVPLPLISYGGSSLVATMCSMGILLNISRQVYKK